MREQLLGYLVGALEPEEAELIELRLRLDPQLQAEIEQLRDHLAPLAADAGHHEPPLGLALRTCCYVAERSRSASAERGTHAQHWVLQDLLVAAGILIAASMFFFPAVNYSRYQAQIAGCQNSLRQLATAMLSYSRLGGGHFPVIPLNGKFATSAAYAPVLMENGLVTDPRVFMCPTQAMARETPLALATRAQVEQASGTDLPRLQDAMGGDFRSTLGYLEKGQYHPTKNLGRTYFALLSDAPGPDRASHQSTNHGGCGQNVGFEDGHVEFLKTCHCRPHGRGVPVAYNDDIFENDEGLVGPGTRRDDAVIARGPIEWTPPIVPVSLDR